MSGQMVDYVGSKIPTSWYNFEVSIEPFLSDVTEWSEETDGVQAVGLCGSHARGDAQPDSDIDLIIVCRHPQAFLECHHWVGAFGEPQSTRHEDYNLVQSIRVNYINGHEVEFGFTIEEWCSPPIDEGTAQVIADGLIPMYDPDKRLLKALRWVSKRQSTDER